jgi:hypothetical protein
MYRLDEAAPKSSRSSQPPTLRSNKRIAESCPACFPQAVGRNASWRQSSGVARPGTDSLRGPKAPPSRLSTERNEVNRVRVASESSAPSAIAKDGIGNCRTSRYLAWNYPSVSVWYGCAPRFFDVSSRPARAVSRRMGWWDDTWIIE